MLAEKGMIKCRLFPTGSNTGYVFRPSLLHVMLLLACVLLTYRWILMRFEQVTEKQRKPIDDIFEWNITQSQGTYGNYMLFRRTAIEGNYGDYSCSSSVRWRKCAFQVTRIVQATQICDAFGNTCKAFILKSEKGRLIAYLKHSVLRPMTDKNAALFVKKLFIPRLDAVRDLVRRSAAT